MPINSYLIVIDPVTRVKNATINHERGKEYFDYDRRNISVVVSDTDSP
jgi:hypothetical protein